MSKFLKYVGVIIASGLYIWAIKFLFEDDNWAGISALTTMLLAIAAFWSIRENRRIRDKDIDRKYKKEALKEISEWSEASYNLFYDMQQIIPNLEPHEARKLEKTLTILWVKRDAIYELACDVDIELAELVNLVKNDLDDYWKKKGGWTPNMKKKQENLLERLFTALFKKTVEKRAKLKL